MRKLTKLLFFITDWELFKKPNSMDIREQVVKDILSVDPTKWFHPKLPNGEVNSYCGTIEKDENGKDVMKGIDFMGILFVRLAMPVPKRLRNTLTNRGNLTIITTIKSVVSHTLA